MDKLVLVDTHANGDALRDNLAPDISVYAADNIPDADAKTDFSRMELFVELKFAETSDPFRDPKGPRRPQAEDFRFENDSEVSQLNHGQLCSYVLHRDIIAGNILITCEGKGLLIDWDLSIKLIDPKTGKKVSSARRPDRTVSGYFFAVDLSLIIFSGNVAVYVSCASSQQ